MKAISEFPTSGAPMLPAVGASWHSGRGLALANCHRPAANLGQKVGHLVDVGVNGMAPRPAVTLPGLGQTAWIVVVDNFDRWQYSAGLEALRDLRFGRIDFFGPSPASGLRILHLNFHEVAATASPSPGVREAEGRYRVRSPHAVPVTSEATPQETTSEAKVESVPDPTNAPQLLWITP
jgi:hypothetical protein